MEYETLVGTFGASLILIGFIFNQVNVWKNDSLSYDVANVLGGAVLMYYALLLTSWPFFVLNTVWTVVSLTDVIRYKK